MHDQMYRRILVIVHLSGTLAAVSCESVHRLVAKLQDMDGVHLRMSSSEDQTIHHVVQCITLEAQIVPTLSGCAPSDEAAQKRDERQYANAFENLNAFDCVYLAQQAKVRLPRCVSCQCVICQHRTGSKHLFLPS